jgi:hypothetical protein
MLTFPEGSRWSTDGLLPDGWYVHLFHRSGCRSVAITGDADLVGESVRDALEDVDGDLDDTG